MTSSILKFSVAGLVALGCVNASSAQTNSARSKFAALFGDETIAKGKGFEIKRSQLDDAVISLKASLTARGDQIPPDRLALIERQVLERLIQIQALLKKATDADRTSGKEVSGKSVDLLLKRAGTEEALSRQLKAVGMTLDELRGRLLDEATAEAVVERELKIEITDDQTKKFYDEHPAEFEMPEMVRLSQIFLATRESGTNTELSDEKKAAKRKQAEALLKRARDGEDFTKLAEEFSDDPAVKMNHGEYKFSRMDQVMDDIKSAAFTMNTNQVSDIISSPVGLHILKLSEKIPAAKVELAKVSDNVKTVLKQQALQKVLPDYLEKLKKDAEIQILDAKLSKVELPSLNDSQLPPTIKADDSKKADDAKKSPN
jgi:parvulin-like peptidyl-prolyl isomerase